VLSQLPGAKIEVSVYLALASIPHERPERTMPIEVEARGPAHVVIRYGIFRILTYANGRIAEPGPNVVYAQGPFRKALDGFAADEALSVLEIRSCLHDLLYRVDRHGHGGLMIVSNAQPQGVESVSWRIEGNVLRLADVSRLREETLRRSERPASDPDRISFSRARERSRMLSALAGNLVQLSAALALTDGCLWLDGGLSPRGFGVFAEVEARLNVGLARDAAATEVSIADFRTLGARHRALAALAARNPGCPAIAVSVDGGLSAALRVKERDVVLVWRFQMSDLDADDPFDPHRGEIWQGMLRDM